MEGVSYTWDRGTGVAFLQGGRLLDFCALEWSGCDNDLFPGLIFDFILFLCFFYSSYHFLFLSYFSLIIINNLTTGAFRQK